MDVEIELVQALGSVVYLEQLVHNIYYVAVKRDESSSCDEYYAITTETPLISSEAKAYGKPLPSCPDILLYDCNCPDGGAAIVYYEYQRYCAQNGLPVSESLRDLAAFGMESNPEYFGTYPVPAETLCGHTVRYWTLANGIYWLESEQCSEVLSVAYPLWDDLTDYAQALAQPRILRPQPGYGTEYKGTLFFSKKTSCIAIWELCTRHSEWVQSGLVDRPALMNAVWKDFPEYAAALNRQELMGEHDLLGTLMRSFGTDAERRYVPGQLLSISPESGTDFLRFNRQD